MTGTFSKTASPSIGKSLSRQSSRTTTLSISELGSGRPDSYLASSPADAPFLGSLACFFSSFFGGAPFPGGASSLSF